MKKVSTPTNIKRFLICYSPYEIEHFCKDKEVDVLHITANVESRISGGCSSNEVEFGCPIPKAFEVDEDNPYFTTIDGVLFSKDKKILVAFPKRDDDYEYTIPDGVTCIGYEAFVDQRHLTSIHIPDSVEVIESRAFLNCYALKELTLPRSLKGEWNYAFEHCYSLERIDISPDNEMYATIDGVLFSKDMKQLHMYPIKKKGEIYKIPEGVEIIGENAFHYVEDIQRVILPSTLEDIDGCSFLSCQNLQDVDGLPELFL